MDQPFFNVGLSASLWLLTHPRFASHPATICWICLCGQFKAKASWGCFLAAFSLLLPGMARPLLGRSKVLLHLGCSSVGRRDCESSPKLLGLNKICNKGDLSQPKLSWRTRTMHLRADLHGEREGWKCSGRISWWFYIPLGILEWIDAVRFWDQTVLEPGRRHGQSDFRVQTIFSRAPHWNKGQCKDTMTGQSYKPCTGNSEDAQKQDELF